MRAFVCVCVLLDCVMSEYKIEENKVLDYLDKVTIAKREIELVSNILHSSCAPYTEMPCLHPAAPSSIVN